jgi:beta-phosphoglucomutase-like phosphatase (HAD superfamily)
VAVLELVIFDCDGVLVDSERISNQILLEMLDELGLRLSLADMREPPSLLLGLAGNGPLQR